MKQEKEIVLVSKHLLKLLNVPISLQGLNKIPKYALRHKKSSYLFEDNCFIIRAENGTRTRDLRITNALLYQLSYFGNICFFISGAKIQGLFDICKKIR